MVVCRCRHWIRHQGSIMWIQSHGFCSISILVIVTFFSDKPATAQEQAADVAFVIDRSPALQQDWNVTRSNNEMRFGVVQAIIWSLLNASDVDYRVGVFVADDQTPIELLSFKEGLKKDEIRTKIEGRMMQLTNKKTQMKLDAIIDRVKKEAIEKSDGNRPEAPDLIVWAMLFQLRNRTDPFDFRIELLNDVDRDANGGIDLLVLFVRGSESIHSKQCQLTEKYCYLVVHHISQMDKVYYMLGGDGQQELDIIYNPNRYEVPKRLKAMLDQCASTSSDDGPCYFNAEEACVRKRTYRPSNPPPHLLRYCMNGQGERDCENGRQECDRLCDQETDHEERPCNASCDGQGWVQYRPSKSQTDPLLQYCPWKVKPCQGGPCQQTVATTTSTVATTGTTSTSMTTSTSTSKKSTTSRGRTTTKKRPTVVPPAVSTPASAPAATESTESVEAGASTTMTTSTKEFALETWQIVLIVIAPLALIALIVLVAVCVVLQNRKRQRSRQAARKHGYRSPGHVHRSGVSPTRWDRGRADGSRNWPRSAPHFRPHERTYERSSMDRRHPSTSPRYWSPGRRAGYSPRPAAQFKPGVIGAGALLPRADRALDVGGSISTGKPSPGATLPKSRPSGTARPSTRPSSSKHRSSSKITSQSPRTPQTPPSSLPTTSRPSTSHRPPSKYREVVPSMTKYRQAV